MSIFGKILAVFNVFAILGALVLMGMNYVKRQNWEYAVFRQDLMIDGLPLDNAQTDALQQLIVDKIGEKTRRELFQQAAPNTPVATQKEELDRVQRELQGRIQGAGDKQRQIVELASILTPMANTSEQRRRMVAYQTYLKDGNTFAALKARLLAAHTAATAPRQGRDKAYEERFHDALAITFSDPPGPLGEEFLAVMKPDTKKNFDEALTQSLDNQLAQLQGQFEQMFRNAWSGGESVQPGGTAQQKRTIARLLFNMVEVSVANVNPDLLGEPAYRRFIAVVGVKAAVEAVNDQAVLLQALTFETQAERQRERNLFAVEHRKAVDLVLEKKAEVDQHTLLLNVKKQEKETHETALARRREDVKFYEQHLADERRKTTQELERLRKLSDRLFAERVRLRQTSEENQKLEKQIEALETGR